MLSGLLLLVSIPIPLSNTFPAVTVIFIAAGALERDGLFFLAGCMAFVSTLIFFSLLAIFGTHIFDTLKLAIFGF